MHRFAKLVVVGVAMATLLAGTVQAAKPGSSLAAGLAFAASNGNQYVTLPGGGANTTVLTLTLPVEGRYVVNAAVTVGENSDAESTVSCSIQSVPAPSGGGWVDQAFVKLAASTPAGNDEPRIALTGVVDRAASGTSMTVTLGCSSFVPAYARGSMNAVSVSSITTQ